MKVALAQWRGRISPVFDVARGLLLAETENSSIIRTQESVCEEMHPVQRARRLAALGAQVLICGAVSREMEEALRAEHIEVVSQICGPVDEVLGAFLNGQLKDAAYLMPGCCRRRRRRGGCGPGGRGGLSKR